MSPAGAMHEKPNEASGDVITDADNYKRSWAEEHHPTLQLHGPDVTTRQFCFSMSVKPCRRLFKTRRHRRIERNS